MDAQTLVDERGELWLALATLWLEREPKESDYARMIEVIERHDLSTRELEWVFRLELAPVLSRQQMSVASEWHHFDDHKLLRLLVAHNLQLKGWRRKSWALFSGLTTLMTRHRWNELMERLMIARGKHRSKSGSRPLRVHEQYSCVHLPADPERGDRALVATLSTRESSQAP